MLFLTIFDEGMFQIIEIKTHPWHRCLKLTFFSLCIYVKSLKTVPSYPVKSAGIEIIVFFFVETKHFRLNFYLIEAIIIFVSHDCLFKRQG